MAEPTQWEYRVETFGKVLGAAKDEELCATLNGWGEEGWEVIAALPRENTNKVRVLAKRPLSLSARRRRSLPESSW